MAAYRRVLLKVSGESFRGEDGAPVSADAALGLAREIVGAADEGVGIGVVVGGGNVIRGITVGRSGRDRVASDYMGMLATVLNGAALREAFLSLGRDASLFSAIPCEAIAERYHPLLARERLDAGAIAIFAGGTGNPLLSTDTAAALRAVEIGADILLKATKVDGVYDSDPMVDAGAHRFDTLSYLDVISQRLEVMDLTAVSVCREHGLEIMVFALAEPGNTARAVRGESVGTIIKGGE